MPPTFLSRPYHPPAVHETTLSSFQYEHYYPIIDLKGSDKENLLDMLSTYLPCSKCGKDREKDLKMLDGNTDSSAFNSDDITDKTGGYVYIVAPPVTLLGDTLTKIANSNIKEKGDHDDQQTVGSNKSGLIMLIFQQKICHIGKVPWQIFGMEWSYRIMRLHVIFAQTQSDKRSFDGKDKLFPLEILVF
eukprot:9523705-Ditylum_brightwellii.AAC.1